MNLFGHANSDASSRIKKAQKIEAMLGGVSGLELLDLGAGSGILSSYFRDQGAKVVAADRDPSVFQPDIEFHKIDDVLPFADQSFDAVVFNHVIEHVGQSDAQRHMLSEIHRVLRPGGTLYLAAPSKWALIEPHFKLPLLGALPRPVANAFVRLTGKGREYDCFPMSAPQMQSMLSERFDKVEDISTRLFRYFVTHEKPSLRHLPPIPALFPTRAYLATR